MKVPLSLLLIVAFLCETSTAQSLYVAEQQNSGSPQFSFARVDNISQWGIGFLTSRYKTDVGIDIGYISRDGILSLTPYYRGYVLKNNNGANLSALAGLSVISSGRDIPHLANSGLSLEYVIHNAKSILTPSLNFILSKELESNGDYLHSVVFGLNISFVTKRGYFHLMPSYAVNKESKGFAIAIAFQAIKDRKAPLDNRGQ